MELPPTSIHSGGATAPAALKGPLLAWGAVRFYRKGEIVRALFVAAADGCAFVDEASTHFVPINPPAQPRAPLERACFDFGHRRAAGAYSQRFSESDIKQLPAVAENIVRRGHELERTVAATSLEHIRAATWRQYGGTLLECKRLATRLGALVTVPADDLKMLHLAIPPPAGDAANPPPQVISDYLCKLWPAEGVPPAYITLGAKRRAAEPAEGEPPKKK